MKKFTTEQVRNASRYMREIGKHKPAHLAAQAEWPSEEDVRKAWIAFCESWDAACAESSRGPRLGDMRAALQSVRPPAGVVSDDRAALLYLMQQFDNETWQCPNCGHAEDTATMDSAHYLRDYLASSIERKVSDGVMTPIEALQAICDAHKFNSASLPPHRVHEIAQSAITRHLSQPAERGEPVADLEPFREAIVYAATNGNMDKWRRVLAQFDSFAYRYKRTAECVRVMDGFVLITEKMTAKQEAAMVKAWNEGPHAVRAAMVAAALAEQKENGNG